MRTIRIQRDETAGAIVLRNCTIANSIRKPNERLTADEVRSIPPRNYDAMVDNRFILPLMATNELLALNQELFLVRRTDLRYDVVKGTRLNTEPMTKIEADTLISKQSN